MNGGPLLMPDHLQPVMQDHVSLGFDYFQEWRLYVLLWAFKINFNRKWPTEIKSFLASDVLEQEKCNA